MRAPYAVPLNVDGEIAGIMKITETHNGLDIGIRILPEYLARFIPVHLTINKFSEGEVSDAGVPTEQS